MNKKALGLAITFIFVMAAIFNLGSAVAATTNNARLESVNSSINLAFTNVLNAERAGGNVTLLLARLNSAVQLLADAENSLNAQSTANATTDIENANSIATQVNNEALQLLNQQNNESKTNTLYTLVFSITGALVLVTILFLAWRRLKRNYYKKLMYSKPEVVKNAN